MRFKIMQLERIGGDERITPYVEWDRSKNTFCTYCGESADTGEHVPSKAFLDDILPDPIHTLPACEKCNNGFSNDESYVACSVDYLKSCVFPEHKLKNKTVRRFKRSKPLEERVRKQFYRNGEEMIIDITPEDVKRFERIMIKLAVGHARHDWDYSMPYEGSSDVKWSFLFRNESEYEDFETCPEMHILPEVGSRSLLTLTEKGQPICMWNEVQPDHYRYLIREFVTSINNFE